MCNECEENEQKLLVNRQTDRPTDSRKAIHPPFFKHGHNKSKIINCYLDDFKNN
jgi:hypothetical protein